jgi:predicted O-methyltransferase YrrM
MAQQKPTGIKKIISSYLIKRGFNRLSAKIATIGKMNAAETVAFLFSKDAELIQPWQFREELLGFASEIEKIHPSTVMEIGTANGGTLFTAARLATDDALIISLDLPEGKFGGGYPAWKIPVYKSFGRARQKIELVRADSHLQESLEKIKNILAGRQIDYLFIDGDHTYEGVKMDFDMYSPFVRKDGIVVFHDIVEHTGDCHVDQFWAEIKQKYRHTEYVNDWKQGKFGVGVIYLD